MDENSIVKGLRERKNSSFRMVYDYYFPSIEKLVRANSGTTDDAEDVFQETMIVLLEKVPAENFVLTASVKTYVYAIASNIWMKRLREKRKTITLGDDQFPEDQSVAEWELIESESIQKNRITRIFNNVTRHCFIFLTKTFLKGVTREKLMLEMGYKNPHTFDNQKYKCLEQARKNS